MRITLEADYAIRMIDSLSRTGGRLSARVLSAESGITLRYALKILHRLCQCGLLRSSQGAGGGYALTKPPGEISLCEVIEAVDGPICVARCLRLPMCTRVPDVRFCVYHCHFDSISEEIRGFLSDVTFAQPADAASQAVSE